MKGKGPYGYARAHRVLEIVCIGGLFVELGYLAWRLCSTVRTPGHLVALTLVLAVGYLVADLVSGVVHWAGDTLGSEATPLVGASFIGPFRRHHTDPSDITRHDFIETNGNNSIVSVGFLSPVTVLMPEEPGWLFYWAAVMWSLCTWMLGTNQFHKWAHAPRPPAWVRALQRTGVILDPVHHRFHHQSPHLTHYCITHGHCDRLLGRMRVFRRLESAIARSAPHWLNSDPATGRLPRPASRTMTGKRAV